MDFLWVAEYVEMYRNNANLWANIYLSFMLRNIILIRKNILK